MRVGSCWRTTSCIPTRWWDVAGEWNGGYVKGGRLGIGTRSVAAFSWQIPLLTPSICLLVRLPGDIGIAGTVSLAAAPGLMYCMMYADS